MHLFALTVRDSAYPDGGYAQPFDGMGVELAVSAANLCLLREYHLVNERFDAFAVHSNRTFKIHFSFTSQGLSRDF
jgi:hypothetical protein